MTDTIRDGSVFGAPRLILQAEGAVVLAAAATAYGWSGAHWTLFAMLFLVPDLAMLAYLAGARVGAASYNLAHSYILPTILLGIGLVIGSAWFVPVALIWIAHIGFDRMIGYGLKYDTAFGDTHLGRKVKREARA